jgi:hypothetical protein
MRLIQKAILMAAAFSFVGLGCDTGTGEERGRFSGGGKADDVYSCVGFCGDKAPGGCWCDEKCDENNDCCADKVEICDEGGESEPTDDERLADFVKENLDTVTEVANQKFPDHIPENGSVNLEEDTIKCLAWSQNAGTCVMHGDTGWPNSDTVFVITVAMPGFQDCDYETIEFDVVMIDGEC